MASVGRNSCTAAIEYLWFTKIYQDQHLEPNDLRCFRGIQGGQRAGPRGL